MDRIDVIKIDIEGSELPCLLGGLRTLERFKPKLIIEVQDSTARMAGYESRDILDFLSPLGYSFFSIGNGGRLLRIGPDGLASFQNVLCICDHE